MSSSGRYQSRVLSFLSQQSMQWRDRAAKAARQTRLAMTWGVQMALYPIYVLFQSTRLVGYQLRQAVTRLMPLLEAVKEEDFDPQVGAPPVESDAPIHNTLAYLETLELPVILSPKALSKENVRSLPAADQEQADELASSAAEGWIYPAIPLQFDPELQRSLSLELTRTAGVAIALSPQWQLVVPPSMPEERSESSSDSVVGELAVMGFSELALPSQEKKRLALQRAIAQLRQPLVPLHDGAGRTVNVTQMVRGVACLLATQALVLVNNQNQVLDILTPYEQFRLHQRILLETATFYRRYRLQLDAQRAEIRARALSGKGVWRFLPPPRQTQKTLPPVRAFQSLMEWVQKSPVAIATNLFQESELLALPDASGTIPARTFPNSRRRDISLPSVSLPSAPLAPSPKRSFWQDLLYSLGVRNASDSGAAQKSSSASTFDPTAPIAPQRWFDPDNQSSDSGCLNANDLTLARRRAEASPAIPSLPRRSRWMPDWASVFFKSGDSLDMDLADSEAQGWAIAPSTPSDLGQTRRFPDPNDDLAPDWSPVTAFAEQGWTDDGRSPGASLSRKRRYSDGDKSLAVDDGDSDSLVSNIVEAPATLVGYVKHPLEQLLEWIDLGMVWLENVVERLWSWLKRSD